MNREPHGSKAREVAVLSKANTKDFGKLSHAPSLHEGKLVARPSIQAKPIDEEWGCIIDEAGNRLPGEVVTASPTFKRILIPALNCPFANDLRKITKRVIGFLKKTLFCTVKEIQVKFCISHSKKLQYIGFNQVLILVHRILF